MPGASCSLVAPAALAALIASSMSVIAVPARSISACVRSWIASTRAISSVLREAVAGLAGVVDHQQRAVDVVLADLHRAFALVGHVAIRARDAAAGVDALAPQLELRVLRLDDLGAGLGVLEVVEPRAVGELVLVVGLLDLLDLQAVVPREEQRLLRPAVVLDVALAADEGAHLLPRGVDVGIVRRALRRPCASVRCWGGAASGRRSCARARMPLTKPGRVTRSDIIFGSWQSTHETGCALPPAWAARVSRVVADVADRVRAGGGVVGGDAVGRSLQLGVGVGVAHRAHLLEALHHRRPGEVVDADVGQRLALRFQARGVARSTVVDAWQWMHAPGCGLSRTRLVCSWSNSM